MISDTGKRPGRSIGHRPFFSSALFFCFVATLASADADAVSGWLVSDGSAAPGESAQIEVRFRNDGDVWFAQAKVFVDWPLSIPAAGTTFGVASTALCVSESQSRAAIELVDHSGTPHETLVCRIPVTPRPDETRRTVRIAVVGTCLHVSGSPVPCERGEGSFHIDGPAPWRERNLVVVPKASPLGPSRSALLDFDYASPQAAPLQTFDAPRPRDVSSSFAGFPDDGAFTKAGAQPNAAVAALLRSVRASYQTEADVQQALGSARADPQVEAALTTTGWYGARVYPAQPTAGVPFALWLTTGVCTAFGGELDDRHVTVESGRIDVEVPFGPFGGGHGVCPGGELHFLWNMPGVPAGQYTLRIATFDNLDNTDSERYSIPVTVVAQGAATSALRSIPAVDSRMLGALAIALALVAASRIRVLQSKPR
jgi:hypothetical protein